MTLHTGARRLTTQEWDELSAAVFDRDGWSCLASRLDPDAGPCHDNEGNPIDWSSTHWIQRRPRRFLTLQHVQINGRTDHDIRFLLTLCWGHHLGHGEKGGRIWSKIKAAAVAQRAYLIKKYPELAA